ncbi:hypothetical protein HDU85_007368 [Gaertneriomyces sp. JEL0708]|nr:hypothetical protein HDU85_007368 [Gaertneriomyces sp. JEL0708]
MVLGRVERTGKGSVDAAALNSNRGVAAAFRRVPASRSLLGGRKSRPEAPSAMLLFPSDGLPLVPSIASEARQTEVASAVAAVGTVDVAVVAETAIGIVAVGIVDVAGAAEIAGVTALAEAAAVGWPTTGTVAAPEVPRVLHPVIRKREK